MGYAGKALHTNYTHFAVYVPNCIHGIQPSVIYVHM